MCVIEHDVVTSEHILHVHIVVSLRQNQWSMRAKRRVHTAVSSS